MATDVDRIQIESEGLLLEGVLHRPQADTATIVVVCHPHPQYGGSMDNNVVMAAVEGVLELGWPRCASTFAASAAARAATTKVAANERMSAPPLPGRGSQPTLRP